MPPVLTEAATVSCLHEGTVVATSARRALTVDGAAVLTPDDLLAATIIGCKLTSAPCVRVTVIDAGVSTTLAPGGRPALLATARGATNSGQWLVIEAGQAKLEAT